jgi:HEAT repeat protein
MPVTMEQVRAVLDPDEPNYHQARRLGAEALPHLRELVAAGEPMLASKATYLASLIDAEGSADIINQAAQSPDAVLRVAAAGAARNLPPQEGSDILIRLVADDDVGVRKVALTSAGPAATAELQARIRQASQNDAAPRIRELAAQTLERMRQPPP